MPIPLVHIGVVVGGVMTFVGTVIAIYGAWPVLPSPKIAVLGMGFSGALLVAFAVWFWAIPSVFIENSTAAIPPDNGIYQAGVVVGKAFGARRIPNDATRFGHTLLVPATEPLPAGD
jgi:hypothetical protein